MNKKVYVLSADMGYGHQRASFPLLDLCDGRPITVNEYEGITEQERKYWHNSLKSYEFVSRLKKIPLLGDLIFGVMDEMQEIKPYYPFRDLSSISLQQKFFLRSIKKGLGKDLIGKLSVNPLPIISTFFVATYFAEYFQYPGIVYQVICDSDASRAWGPIMSGSRTIYLLPNDKLKKRFLMYGVDESRLLVTGFPLPKENVGANQEILLADLNSRLNRLDNNRALVSSYGGALSQYGLNYYQGLNSNSPIHIVFAVGGAGAQKEIGGKIIEQLAKNIKNKLIKVTLVAGVRHEVKEYFESVVENANISSGVDILYRDNKHDYFRAFNELIREADILWTKPSELSFYCALGLPIIISETVGSQEDFNRDWLLGLGAGVDSGPLDCLNEWLHDYIVSGRFARAALNGFLNAESMGTYNIEKLIG
jgi:RNA-binding protein YhbY